MQKKDFLKELEANLNSYWGAMSLTSFDQKSNDAFKDNAERYLNANGYRDWGKDPESWN